MQRHDPHTGPGWTSTVTEGSPFRLRYKVGLVNGRLAVTHVCIEPAPGSPARSVTRKDLAAINPRDLLEREKAFRRALEGPGEHDVADAFIASAVTAERQRRRRWSEADLAHVRDLYVRCRDADPPRSAREWLVTQYGISARTADRLIARARTKYPAEMGPRTRGPAPRGEDHG